MKLKSWWGTIATALLFGVFATTVQAGPLKVCDDDSGWPPYSYADPQNPSKVIGAAAEVVTELVKRAGHEARINLLPWKRCLAEVESGETAMLINAAYSKERAEKYYLSNAYYVINSGLFYLTSKFPNKPEIKTVDDMKKYSYCGLFGYNYTMYPIPEDQLDTGAKDEVSRFKKLRAGRCDLALGDIEILRGFSTMGTLDLTGIDSIPIPEAKPKEFYMMISRKIPDAEKLVKSINEGLEQIKTEGVYQKIMQKYGVSP